jgi:hypothetical protein
MAAHKLTGISENRDVEAAEARAPDRGIYAASAQDEFHDVGLFWSVHMETPKR